MREWGGGGALPAGQAHWEVLLRARAIECQAWVVAAAQAGRHNERRESYGHAIVVDPWGTVVARLEDPLATGAPRCCAVTPAPLAPAPVTFTSARCCARRCGGC